MCEERPASSLEEEPVRFEVKPKACGFRRGVNVLRLNQLSDELEVEQLQATPGPGWKGSDPH